MTRPEYPKCPGCDRPLLFGGVCQSCRGDPMSVEDEIMLYGTEEQQHILEHGTNEEKAALVAQVTEEQKKETERRRKEAEQRRNEPYTPGDDIPF